MGSLMSVALLGQADLGQIIMDRDKYSPEELDRLMIPLARGLQYVFRFALGAGVLGVIAALTIPGGKARDQAVAQQ